MCLPWTNLLGLPSLQAGQVNQGVVSTNHTQDMGSGVLPSVLHELLKPTLRMLRFLNRTLPLYVGLVFGELQTDEI